MFDALIIGGGLVGSSLACALQQQGLKIGLVESHAWAKDTDVALQYDDRVIALAYSSRNIFKGLGLWSKIASQATPIQHIHVSDRGHFGFARLHSKELRLEALGHVIEAKLLGQALQQKINQARRIDIFAPAQVKQVQLSDELASVDIAQAGKKHHLQTRLLIAADGSNSAVCQQLKLPAQRYHYGQTALIANVTPTAAHNNIAYERFTHSGPLALLPMRENRCSLVWTVRNEQVASLLKMRDADFLSALQQRFGWRLGRFQQIGQRHAYPLSLMVLEQPLQKRLLVIGNAAHTLHPVGGQGFNLGLRDASAVAQSLQQAQQQQHDLGAAKTLQYYKKLRQTDQTQAIRLTNALVHAFSNESGHLSLLRNLGLLSLDQFQPLKQVFAKHMAGLGRQTTRLDAACRDEFNLHINYRFSDH